MTKLFAAPTGRQIDLGLAVLRAVVGVIFVAHGAQKLFVYGFAGVGGAFAGMGIPLPQVAGPMVGMLEFFGGIALIAGLLTRPAAVGLAVTMVGAIFFAHLPAGFFLPNGYEFALTLLGAAATLAITGAGGWSVDALIADRSATPHADAAQADGIPTARRAA
jgi:putative oxidoreductase